MTRSRLFWQKSMSKSGIDTIRIQEALEQQVVAQRVEVGDLQRIGHQRARARAAPRADRAAVVLGPVDEVRDDQEAAREAHLQDGRDLEVEPLHVARPLLVALCGVGVEMRQPPSSPSCESWPK